jgi:uncharacterized protein involved in response to NO
MAIIRIEEPQSRARQDHSWQSHPFLGLGFRPFYLLGAAFAAVSVPLWIARYFGVLGAFPNVDLNWHMHEMVYGFAVAVIIGFLFTAGRNWTGLWTPRRGTLAMLIGLWLAGRIAMLTAAPWLAALVDIAFLPAAAYPLYKVLQRSGNKRNLFLIGLLALLTLANGFYHASVLGVGGPGSVKAIHLAILIIVMIESVIGGRVIPGFTRNAVPGSDPVTHDRRDRISMGLTAAVCAGWALGLPGPAIAAMALVAACSQLVRIAGWQSYFTLRHPLLWILHLSYAWIPIGFLLLALSAIGLVPASAAIHALAVGSMAGLIIGMITRTALGHTGRALKAGPGEVVMYVLIQAGAVARLFASLTTAGGRDEALLLAAAFWAGAFLLYAFLYGPYLWRARVDGREG